MALEKYIIDNLGSALPQYGIYEIKIHGTVVVESLENL
jgi:hypothetical protein